jgi:undecaprenyl-diphosphatase
MYDIWVAVIIGIVEGLTEFLPVSSTGHMILTSHILNVPETDETMKTFEIVIQLGAILAVALIYWRKLLGLFGLQERAATAAAQGQRMNLLHILIAILPALLLAFLLQKYIKMLFSAESVLLGLVIGGIFLIVAEKQQPVIKANTMDELTYKQSLFIGFAQCLSLWPGFSRAGATIAGGMLAGASRAAAAEFSFIIAIPVMCAATGYEMLTNYKYFTSDVIGFFAVGFIVSFIVAILAVVSFIKLVQKLKLTYFAYYRFVLAGLFWIYMTYVGF